MATKKTAEKPKVATHVLDVNAAQLHRVLYNASLFAGKDDTLPMLTGVHVESDSERLLAVATDRYTLGVSWVPLDSTNTTGTAHDGDGCAFNLSPSDLSTLIKVSKTPARDTASRLCSITQNYDGTVEFKFWTGETITVKHHDHEFVKWRHLFPDTEAEVARTAFGLNQAYLAKFGKVISDTHGQQLAIFSFDAEHDAAQKKPYVVRLGDRFVGLIMPVRLNEACRWRKPEWL